MPQREFWTAAHPVEVRWHYRCDPLEIDGPSQLSVSVYDQAGSLMEHGSITVDAQLTHETVADALRESWEGFLFGERHAAPRALKLVGTRYYRARVRRLAERLAGGS